MAALLQDLRYAVRSLRRSPSFTLTVVITLGLGIGATTGTFSIVNAVLLAPLPYYEPDRLVRVEEVTRDGEPFPVSEPTFLDIEGRSRTVSRVAAIAPRSLTLTGEGEPVRLQGAAVSQGFLDVLGVTPATGRNFTADEDRPGGEPAVILSHDIWRQRFNSDPAVVGRTIRLDGNNHVVVGVMPRDFSFLPADVWVPLRAAAQTDRTNHSLDLVARLSEGTSIDAARAELQSIAAGIAREHASQAGWSVRVTPLTEWLVGPAFRRTVWTLLASVVLLLLIACANVANLLLARAAYRRGEVSIRTALGAGRLHIVRQLLLESLLLATAGGWIGIVISFWIADALSALTADLLVVPPAVTTDGRVLLFATALILLTTVIFGLLPAWNAASGARPPNTGEGERVSSSNRRMTESFVVAQVTVAMVLLVGSGLMIRSFWRLQNVDPGFVADDVLAVPLSLPDDQGSPERAPTFFNDLFTRLESLPGVVSVGATTTNPFRQWGFSNNVTPEDRAAETPPTGLLQAGWRAVTPGFFESLRIPVMAGRVFTSRDGADGQRSVVVSASLARALWPERDAVGRRLYWGGVDGTPWTVVGVVGDVRDLRVETPPQPMLYLPHRNIPLGSMTVLVRKDPGAGDLAAAIRDAVHGIDPSLPVPEVHTLAANREAAVSTPRIRTLVLTLVGTVALALASVGLYGLVAFGVAQRVREIGIRMALGASRSDIVRLFLSRGLVLAAVGVTAGLLGAWMLSRAHESLLFETEVRDPLLFTAAAAVLAAVMAFASYLPARRAAALDPVRVLNR